jgi:hypothetical protein
MTIEKQKVSSDHKLEKQGGRSRPSRSRRASLSSISWVAISAGTILTDLSSIVMFITGNQYVDDVNLYLQDILISKHGRIYASISQDTCEANLPE